MPLSKPSRFGGQRRARLWLMACSLLVLGAGLRPAHAEESPAATPPTSEADRRFFEERVRPLLAEHCHACHGAKKQQSGLRLDSRAAVLKGSDNGPVVVPREPAGSRLLEAIGYADSLKMPPAGPLPAAAVATLREWVERGLPWGLDAGPTPAPAVAEGRQHWAFQPVVRPPVPAEPNLPGVSPAGNEIDRFIGQRLQQAGLAAAPPADRRTLYRRAAFTLLGLPPQPDAVARFEADPRPTPQAFADVVEQLLQSPHYGERWGRHWLDLARYADNKGYVFFEEQTHPWGYTYRDWVIRSLNEDLPYDQFVVAQLAADQLPPAERDRHLAALGFITIGGHFVNNIHDIFDDRIDVVGRGLLGLTVSCARCHDHKFDPIPQSDYYALYGIFRSSPEPLVPPRLPGPIPETEEFELFEQELATRQERLQAFLRKKHHDLTAGGRQRFAEYLLAAHASRDQPSTEDFMLLIPEGDLHPTVVQRYWLALQRTKRNPDALWRVWHTLASLPAENFPQHTAAALESLRAPAEGLPAGNPLVLAALAQPLPANLSEVAQRLGDVMKSVDNRWQQALAAARDAHLPPPVALPEADAEELRQWLYGPEAPANMPFNTGWGVLTLLPDRGAQAEYQKLLKELENWLIRSPGAPPRAMVLDEAAEPYSPRIFLRGNPNRTGATVDRRFLTVLSAAEPAPFQQGSGRLELARQIASSHNPLTARVLVNRVWQQHFGVGLVKTPSDFGVRSEPPSHPQLLDWLAATFMERGWSLKQLHRLLLASDTWQRASVLPDEAARTQAQLADPENRLLWRATRRRHDFETLRDSLLWAAGTLDTRVGGPSIPLLGGPPRRSVYGFIDRLALPGLLRTFDFPSPDSSAAQRDNTTVAPQALFLMNGPLVGEVARLLVNRPEITGVPPGPERVAALVRLLFARPPTAAEQELVDRFFGEDPAARNDPAAWQTLAEGLLLTNEFVFTD